MKKKIKTDSDTPNLKKKKISTDSDTPNLKTWGFAAGATLLLAVLTIVLCIMGGVFDFKAPDSLDDTNPPMSTPDYIPTNPPSTPPPDDNATPSPIVKTYTISSVAGRGGSISPTGIIDVKEGESKTFTITPENGYEISELKVDGVSVSATNSHTFSNIGDNHSIYAVFRKASAETAPPETAPPSSPTDIG